MAERPQPDLGSVLRHEADRHLPDRGVMLTRIVVRRSEPAARRWALSLRPVAAAASVVATLVVGFAGIRLAGDRPDQDRTPAATEGSPSPAPGIASPSPPARDKTPQREAPAHQGPVEKPPPPPSTVTPAWQPADRFLSSAAALDTHSVGTWAQGNVTLTTTEPMTALDMVINVAKTAGVEDAGKWSTIPADMITITVADEKDRLVYRFTLKQGTLAPGSYVFAAQYTHAAGERSAAADTYGALATAASGQAVVTGAFPPK
ncbi:hypothetical protein [Actinoplanes sp. NPDC026670]|uniref:hypothetical protein n=1 Tax=Actinoplanes sp. NPDC026670 TaxID=3154700 RepID=UPI0033FEAB01